MAVDCLDWYSFQNIGYNIKLLIDVVVSISDSDSKSAFWIPGFESPIGIVFASFYNFFPQPPVSHQGQVTGSLLVERISFCRKPSVVRCDCQLSAIYPAICVGDSFADFPFFCSASRGRDSLCTSKSFFCTTCETRGAVKPG
jgi:hypothetical protein